MSDSDDTDLLLVIPPNFFSIDSEDSETDRELSLHRSFKFKPKHREEKKLVSDLFNNVNELASRVSFLEDIEGSRHSNCGESRPQSGNAFQNMNAFKGSTDSLSSNYLNRSPTKSLRPQSLPPTPPTNRCRHISEEFSKSHSLNTSPEKNSAQFLGRLSQKTDKNPTTSEANNQASSLPESPCKKRLFSDSESYSTNRTGNYFMDVDFKSCFTQPYLESKNLPLSKSYPYDKNPTKHLDLPEVDRLLKEMELTEEEIESKSKSKDNLSNLGASNKNFLFSNRWNYEEFLPSIKETSNFSKGDTLYPDVLDTAQAKSSVDKNSCVRRLDFDSKKRSNLENGTGGENSLADNDRRNEQYTAGFKTGEPHRNGTTTYSGLSSLNRDLYKIDSESSIIEELRELDKKTQEIVANSLPRSQVNSDLRELNPNFSRLLNSQSENGQSVEVLKQKLEEEHHRRQHCENLVIDLQQEVLEWRERLAVAVAIDAEKNRAIGKLETTWRRTVEHWRQLEDQRHNLAVALQMLKEERREEITQLNQKIRRYELEIAQALDLAAGYKVKADAAEKDRASFMVVADKKNYELGTKLKEIEEINKSTHSKLMDSEEKIQQLQEKLTFVEQNCAEISVEDRLENYLDFMKHVEHQLLQESQERLAELETELSMAVSERDRLLVKLKEESQLVETLKDQKKDLLLAVEEAKERERKAVDDVKTSQQGQDKLKKELRVFYQKQLESVVRDKLKEFQSQLDSAEASLKAELHARERALAELAARQMQILNEKHKTELDKLKEEKQEEIKNFENTIADLKRSLELEKARRAEMARELHSVMETQWRQAINIITSQTNFPNKQEPTNEKGEPAVSVHGFEDGYPMYRTENKTMPDQLQKYFQMLLEKMPTNKEELNNSWLYSSFLSDDIAASALQGDDPNAHLNERNDGNNRVDSKNTRGKPPWK